MCTQMNNRHVLQLALCGAQFAVNIYYLCVEVLDVFSDDLLTAVSNPLLPLASVYCCCMSWSS